MIRDELIDENREDIVISSLGKRGKQLSIEAVGAAHAGEYTCIASNIAGSTTRTALLDVNGTDNNYGMFKLIPSCDPIIQFPKSPWNSLRRFDCRATILYSEQ